MKAKEYYAKYGERVKAFGGDAALEMFNEIATEMTEVTEKRKINSARGAISCIEEFNDKWNAICRYFDPPILNQNVLRDYFYEKMGITKEMADRIRKGRIG